MTKILIIILISAFSLPLFVAAETYDIVWDWPEHDMSASHIMPWMHVTPERVRIDVSMTGGTSWREIACGVPSVQGTNTYAWSIPDRAEYLTDNGIIRIRKMHEFGGRSVTVTKPIHLCGIRMVSTPATVTNGVTADLSWVSAGAGEFVSLATLAIPVTGEGWQAQAVLASTDSNAGGITNTAQWSVDGLAAGAHLIKLQSLERPACWRGATLEVVNE